ncbi:hypothetical protein GOC60_14610 [Sinorhizobium meliloti]|nr:hypothetical protein [Sinorhizobium meliloti]
MENLTNIEVIKPDDEYSFDAYELCDKLPALCETASNNGEHFPLVYFRKDGLIYVAKRMTLVRGDQTDGSSNYEIVIDIE